MGPLLSNKVGPVVKNCELFVILAVGGLRELVLAEVSLFTVAWAVVGGSLFFFLGLLAGLGTTVVTVVADSLLTDLDFLLAGLEEVDEDCRSGVALFECVLFPEPVVAFADVLSACLKVAALALLLFDVVSGFVLLASGCEVVVFFFALLAFGLGSGFASCCCCCCCWSLVSVDFFLVVAPFVAVGVDDLEVVLVAFLEFFEVD